MSRLSGCSLPALGHTVQKTAPFQNDPKTAICSSSYAPKDFSIKSVLYCIVQLTQVIVRLQLYILLIIQDCFFVPQSNSRNILRIGLHSLGSALWGDDLCCYDSPKNGHSLTTFLYGLRALLRSSLSVAVVTVPSHLMQVRRMHLYYRVTGIH